MTQAIEKLKADLAALPAKEREEIAYFLWKSLGVEYSPELSEEWLAELERRGDEMDKDPSAALDGEQVFAELRKKYS